MPADGAPDHHGRAVFVREFEHAVFERQQTVDEKASGIAALQHEYRVEDVGARRAVMQPFRGIAEQLGPRFDDCHERVAEPFAFGSDAFDGHELHARRPRNFRRRRGRYDAAPRLHGGHRRFHAHAQRLMPRGGEEPADRFGRRQRHEPEICSSRALPSTPYGFPSVSEISK